jgi:hypothetical protein
LRSRTLCMTVLLPLRKLAQQRTFRPRSWCRRTRPSRPCTSRPRRPRSFPTRTQHRCRETFRQDIPGRHHSHTISKKAARRGAGRGVADHLAIQRISRRRDGCAPVASIALAICVDAAGGRGIIICVPARIAGSRCLDVASAGILCDVRPGQAVGADRAAQRCNLPGQAGRARSRSCSTSAAEILAGNTCLAVAAYRCAAGSEYRSSVKATDTISTKSSGRGGSPGNSAHFPPSRRRGPSSQHCTCKRCGCRWRQGN